MNSKITFNVVIVVTPSKSLICGIVELTPIVVQVMASYFERYFV